MMIRSYSSRRKSSVLSSADSEVLSSARMNRVPLIREVQMSALLRSPGEVRSRGGECYVPAHKSDTLDSLRLK